MELRSSHPHTSLVEAQVSHMASPNLLVLVTYLCNDHGGVPWSYIFYRDENAWICEHLHTSINVKASFPLSLLYPMRTTCMALGPPCRPPNAVRATSQAMRTALSLHTEGQKGIQPAGHHIAVGDEEIDATVSWSGSSQSSFQNCCRFSFCIRMTHFFFFFIKSKQNSAKTSSGD